MKLRFLAVVAVMALALFARSARAQTAYPDLIVTQTGDSIRCAFIDFSETTIRYYRLDTEGKAQKFTAQKAALRYFDRGYYSRREAAAGTQPYVMPMSYYKGTMGKPGADGTMTIIKVEAGMGHRIAKADSRLNAQQKAFIDKMRNGGTFAFVVGRFHKPQFGWAGRVDAFWSSESDAQVGISDKVSLVYVGVDMMGKAVFQEGGNSHFYYDLGLGLGFFNDQVVSLDPNKAKSVTLSGVGVPARFGMGFNIALTDNAAIHFGGNVMVGNIPVTVNGENYKEGITRIGGAGGFTFNF